MKHIICTLLITLFSFSAFAHEEKSSVYDRVMKSGEVRCGYYMFEPATWMDAESGELKGFTVDIWEALGESMGLKIIWQEEVTFGQMFEGLQTRRYDAICSPAWPNAQNARVARFIDPVFYSSVNMFIRADDTRFEGKNPFKVFNSPDITIAVQDGEVSSKIANNRFPNAKQVAIPQAADPTQNEMNVINKKADVTFIDANRAEKFMEKNPNSLKLASPQPVQLFPFRIAVHQDEDRFVEHLNIAIEELHNNGTIDRIIDTYDPEKRYYPRVQKPYEVSK